MKRSLLNMIIDAVSLMIFMFMISTGLILKFILPPGSGRVERLLSSTGRGQHMIDTFMGLPRHDWGIIHFYVSLGFLVLLVIHLVLHWNWIVCMVWGTKNNPQSVQMRLLSISIIAFVVLTLVSPWIGQALGQKKTFSKSEFLERYSLDR